MTRSKAATLGQFFVGGVQYFAVGAFRPGSEQVSEVSERGVFHFWWNDVTRQLSHQIQHRPCILYTVVRFFTILSDAQAEPRGTGDICCRVWLLF